MSRDHNSSSSAAAAQRARPQITESERKQQWDLRDQIWNHFIEFDPMSIFGEKDATLPENKHDFRGSTAEILEATLTKNNEPIAVKVYTKSDENSFREARLMIRLQQQRRPQYIVNVKSVGIVQLRFAMFMELATTSLRKHLCKMSTEGELLLPTNAVLYALQIASALCDMHNCIESESFLHLDLKEANILFFEKTNTVKLCDFGIARKINRDYIMQQEKVVANQRRDSLPVNNPWQQLLVKKRDFSNIVQNTQGVLTWQVDAIGRGTPPYMSKEHMESTDIHPTHDIFAFGCILFNFIMGKASDDLLPRNFNKLTQKQKNQACLSAHEQMRIQIDQEISNSAGASSSSNPMPMFLLQACKMCLDLLKENRPQDGKVLLIEHLLKPCIADEEWRSHDFIRAMAKKYKDLLSPPPQYGAIATVQQHMSQGSSIRAKALTSALFIDPARGGIVAPPRNAAAVTGSGAAAAMPSYQQLPML